jgi:decaprenylphospho-beta-D-ribofuranose 2-oxidase
MRLRISSFDRTEARNVEYVRPDRYRDLFAVLEASRLVIPRGAGLTYCLASAGEDVCSVSTLLFNRVLSFDTESGVIEVEPGIRLGELYRITISRGWVLSVMPGHPSITVGGCIGCNVHGKNQCREGNFSNVVESLTLYHPDHGEMRCSPTEHSDIFGLTIGGFGLTGLVTSVRLRLQRCAVPAMSVKCLPVSDLAATVRAMQSFGSSADLLYSWNNLSISGRRFGQGVVYVGKVVTHPLKDVVKFPVLVPERSTKLPFNLYSRTVTKWMLGFYRRWEGRRIRERVVGLASAVFPVGGKEWYFGLFGPRGFREYQMLVPNASWQDVATALPRLIDRHRVPVTLGSLKLFNGASDYLCFGGTGIALSIDVPAGPPGPQFFRDLDALTRSTGALVNLAKDSRAAPMLVRETFPGYDRFCQGLSKFDSRRRFDSSLRRRLGV